MAPEGVFRHGLAYLYAKATQAAAQIAGIGQAVDSLADRFNDAAFLYELTERTNVALATDMAVAANTATVTDIDPSRCAGAELRPAGQREGSGPDSVAAGQGDQTAGPEPVGAYA
ncbi:hypothetical protein CGZ93_09890 [Enemella dayhoffiae]|uniref:Uncharacterized protein n=1 Tax=Enemella dayhoffiae TaxID=2016507 RepID=A0A255H3C5_9ACTN|nr:hypothetical protein [Enemella dayhoffiae]OYO22190.1 hypothetical protein CGZ93_09890 [Enemella dayhoffiae]